MIDGNNTTASNNMDWKIIQAPIATLCIIILSSITVITGSHYFKTKMYMGYSLHKARFQSISHKYLDIDREERLLSEYYPRFAELYNAGVIGRERRLDWIEALRSSGENAGISNLRYVIEPQSEYAPAYDIDYNIFKLYASRMKLDLGLLHEMDIFNFLQELDKKTKGLYTVSECTFKRRGKDINFEKGAVNIDAICILQWITINLLDKKDI